MHDALDRSLPRGLLFSDLYQFSSERESFFVDSQFPAQAVANGEHIGRDVRTALLQGSDLSVDLRVLRAQLAERHRFVRNGILRLGLADLNGFALRRDRDA